MLKPQEQVELVTFFVHWFKDTHSVERLVVRTPHGIHSRITERDTMKQTLDMQPDFEFGQWVKWYDGWPSPDSRVHYGYIAGITDDDKLLVLAEDDKIYELIGFDLQPVDLTEEIIRRIRQERTRQDEKFGEQNHSLYKWITIEAEEFGELARAVYEMDYQNFEEEAVQVAAVAVVMLESFFRNEGRALAIEKIRKAQRGE